MSYISNIFLSLIDIYVINTRPYKNNNQTRNIMRLISDLKRNESKIIDDIIYTKKDFTTEGFKYYNELYTHK